MISLFVILYTSFNKVPKVKLARPMKVGKNLHKDSGFPRVGAKPERPPTHETQRPPAGEN